MDKLIIVMPAYNEEANIEKTLEEWYGIVEKAGEGSLLVVFDDGSKDRTFEIMKEWGVSHPQFKPVTKKNSGHGATVLAAYHYALDAGADFIFQTDSDGQTDPTEFWRFWERRNDYDALIGWRNARQDGLSRVIVTKTLKTVIGLCFKVNITDANTPFRLMNAHILRENIQLIPQDYFLTNVLLSVIYEKRHQRVAYLPISFKPRQGGVNSINLRKIVGIGKQALHDFVHLNRELDSKLSLS